MALRSAVAAALISRCVSFLFVPPYVSCLARDGLGSDSVRSLSLSRSLSLAPQTAWSEEVIRGEGTHIY